MNDYWNDPPEEPDFPSCPKCGNTETDATYTLSSFICHDCNHSWIPEPDIDAGKLAEITTEIEEFPPADEMPPEMTECAHGNKPEDCDHCAHLSDMAYDAQRERGRN